MAPFKKVGLSPNKKIRDLIEGLNVATLATIGMDQSFATRPVPLTDKSFNGDFWIFVDRFSPVIEAAEKGHALSLHFSSEADKRFLSVEGKAKIIDDKKTKTKFWNDDLLHWFSDGVSDPDLLLVKIHVVKASYWDCSMREMVELEVNAEDEFAAPKSSFAVNATEALSIQ